MAARCLPSTVFDMKVPYRKMRASTDYPLEFGVMPDSTPPTNIHVLIGRNGVGKTYLLNGMTRALVNPEQDPAGDGLFTSNNIFSETHEESIHQIFSFLTFSAFDKLLLCQSAAMYPKGFATPMSDYVSGLRIKNDEWVTITRDPTDLADEFSLSAKLCAIGQKASRWQRALTTLQADPIFAEAEVAGLVNTDDSQFARRAGQKIFRKLSSGHKIVLLTITKLVEKVGRKFSCPIG